MKKKKIICLPENVYSPDGLNWKRICAHCGNIRNHKSMISAIHSSISNRGCICKSAWHKGLTKDTCNSLKIMGQKLSVKLKENFKSGKSVQWNKGLTKDTNDILARQSQRTKGIFKHSAETKEKISLASKEHWRNPNYRHKVITNATLGIRKSYAVGKRKQPINKNTKPELCVQNLLKELNINYTTQYVLYGSYPKIYKWPRYYDIYLVDYNSVIEVHGDYWHAYKTTRDKMSLIQNRTISNDIQKCLLAHMHNIGYYVIWEHESYNHDILLQKITNIIDAIKCDIKYLPDMNIPKPIKILI